MKDARYVKTEPRFDKKYVKPVNDRKVLESDADWYFRTQGKVRGK